MTLQPDVRRPPVFLATSAEVSFGAGFHEAEREAGTVFRWMSGRGVLQFEPSPSARYLELWVFSEFRDLSQRLAAPAGATGEYALVYGWSPLSLPVAAGAGRLELSVNRMYPPSYYPSDPRTLAIRVRDPRLHEDPERHAVVRAQYENALLNEQEILEGRTELRSTPPKLGIDMHGACNVKPPCVYCEWDYSKELEGDKVDRPFTRDTLREWGAFFDRTIDLVNCSIGEPFMMKNFDELLDVFGDTGKVLEMTTNGQILTDRNIRKLIGRPVDLLISLDAATPLTYARLRNDTFEKILANLRRLIEAKGGRGRLPRVHLVFMPMKCNLQELDDFVRLCASLGVDRMVLRPLNYSDSVTLDWERAGYRFVYKDELLPFDTLVRASGRAARLARELGVELADQMDFGGAVREMFEREFSEGAGAPSAGSEPPAAALPPADAPESATGATPLADVGSAPFAIAGAPQPSLGGETRPACLEPWKSLYVLRRGVLPCSYGCEPIAPMEQYREAWNSTLMQAIRRDLLRGSLHDYCLRSPACPIVRKVERTATLPLRQRALMRARHAWWRLNRDTGGLPNRWVYLPVKSAVMRARALLGAHGPQAPAARARGRREVPSLSEGPPSASERASTGSARREH